MSNISRFVRYHALRTPARTAVVYDGHTISYAGLWLRIVHVAGSLRAQKIGAGDRVAMLMKNSAAFLEAAFAISHIGAIMVPINFRLARDEIDYLLRGSGAALLLRDEELGGWDAAVPQTIAVAPEAATDAFRFPARTSLTNDDTAMAPVGPADVMRILYTSGTTDRPKGAFHRYRNFYAKSADQIVELNLSAATRLLVSGPLYHVGAFDLPGIGVLWAGGMLCIQREFDPAQALDLIARERLTASWFAPVMTGAIIASQAASPRDVSSLEWTIGGGERTPEARLRAYARTFPNARYIDAYGLTETCGGDTFMERGREIEKIGSVGRPLSQVDIAIFNEDGQPLPAGEIGEVCIQGAKVFEGYWNAPDKTAASFFGTWFRTGDAGYLDADGFLFLTDRIKDMIISGGENIASSEVERVILALTEVQDAAVIGIADPRWGERPVAVVVFHAGRTASEAAIRAHCQASLASFKVPDRVFVRQSLPRTASGKVLKRELRDELAVESEP